MAEPARPPALVRVAVLSLVCTAGLWLTAPGRAFADGELAEEYVALGDSFAAGPLVPPQEASPCLRSGVDYPHLLAQALHVKRFRDVTCSGATTANIRDTPQRELVPGVPMVPAQPPQLNAVSRHTTLVTVTIGANDIRLAQTALSCVNVLPPPAGTSCEATQTAGGTDRGARAVDSVADKLAATLAAIHDKAPKARVVITSYANYIQRDGCYLEQPVWARDANYMQGLVNRLGRITARIAAEHDAEYVDFIGPGVGHDGCQLSRNWANVVVPGTTLGIVPLHPTALGERNFARILADRLAPNHHSD